MFEKAIEQIKEWVKKGNEKDESISSHFGVMGIPSCLLCIWAICTLFLGEFTFDPTYAVNFPRLCALLSLLYLASRDYTLAEKEIELRKKE